MNQVLIIEDEPLAAKRLQRLLKDVASETKVLAVLDTVKGAVKWLQENQADLIFLDIHLADGNSFSIFDQVEVKIPIIFSTAYDQYAIQAFKHNSVDYLLKPIEKEELARAMDKYKEMKSPPAQPDFAAIFSAMQDQKKSYQKRFMVTSGEKIRSVPIEEVAYFFGQQKYVFLVTHDNRRHIVDYTLGSLEDLLDPDQFFRINRQFIIQYNAITEMFAYSKSRVKVQLEPESDMEAIVSIEKTRRFKEWLNR